jgi:hypothetical protein
MGQQMQRRRERGGLLVSLALICACGLPACGTEPKPEAEISAVTETPSQVEECPQVQVFPTSASEPTQRYVAAKGQTVRLSRFSGAFELTLPVGTIIGRTEQTNNYVPEETETVGTLRSARFPAAANVVHCLTETGRKP